MTTNTKVALSAAGALIIIMIIIVVASVVGRQAALPKPILDLSTGLASTVRDDSHRLDDVPDAKVTIVEFLDFECEACGAFYPYVEELREKYEGQITYIVRYFPLPSHTNSQNAAVAVEAASRQGQFEAMYNIMFQTQAKWGESGESKAALFRSYAETLGLDMDQYDADVADPETLARVMFDFNDGVALGVASTPTFFINDRPLKLTALGDLEAAIIAELAP